MLLWTLSGGFMTGSSEVLIDMVIVLRWLNDRIFWWCSLENSKTDVECQFGRSWINRRWYCNPIRDTLICPAFRCPDWGDSIVFSYFSSHILHSKDVFPISFCTEFSPFISQPSKRRGWSLALISLLLCVRDWTGSLRDRAPYGYTKHEICCFGSCTFRRFICWVIFLQS